MIVPMYVSASRVTYLAGYLREIARDTNSTEEHGGNGALDFNYPNATISTTRIRELVFEYQY
jgi:hypothetical protein